jgi:hypothetical protein
MRISGGISASRRPGACRRRENHRSGDIERFILPRATSKPSSHAEIGETYMLSLFSRARAIAPSTWSEIGSSFVIQIVAQVSSSSGAFILLLVAPRTLSPLRIGGFGEVYTLRDMHRAFHPADKRVAL